MLGESLPVAPAQQTTEKYLKYSGAFHNKGQGFPKVGFCEGGGVTIIGVGVRTGCNK